MSLVAPHRIYTSPLTTPMRINPFLAFISLLLTPGAVLQGSYDPADYPDHDISSHQKFGTITHDGVYVKSMKARVGCEYQVARTDCAARK